MSKQKNKAAAASNTSAGSSAAAPSFVTRNRFELLLVLAVVLVFFNSVFNGYALDDEFYTNGSNELTNKGIAGIPAMFKTRTFYNNDGSGYSYRPITLVSFAIEHSLFGQKPHVSHFINLLFYAISIVLLFRLLRKWMHAYSEWLVFFICLLFAVHPLHTEVVANIKCRDELLSLFFCLLSMSWLWRHYETGRWIYMLLFPLAFFAGILSKFSILPYVFLIPVALWFFTDLKLTRIAVYLAPLLVIIIATYFIMKVLPTQHRELLMHENPFGSASAGMAERAATGFYVLGRYVLLHIFPHPLSYYYGYDYIPLVDWSNLLAIGSLLFHLALGWYCLKNLRSKNILSFAILFYGANLAMFSNIVRPAPGLMAERFAYSASLGFCIAAVVLLFRAGKLDLRSWKWQTAGWPRLVLLLIVFAFSVRSIARNESWENKMTLYGNDMEHLDESAKANMLFGSLVSSSALKNQHYDSLNIVKYHFRRAAEIYPEYATAWSNLGSTYYFLRQYDSSKIFFRKSITLNPKYKEGLFNMGMAHLNSNQDSAQFYLKKKITARDSADFLQQKKMNYQRALAFANRGRDSAEFYFEAAIEADSTYMGPYEQMAQLEAQMGHFVNAVKVIRRAAKNNPHADQPYMNLAALIQATSKDKELAARLYEMAAAKNPKNLERLQNLSNYFYKSGNQTKGNYYDSMYKAEMKRLEKMGRGVPKNKR